jgi:alkylation response protein AidB-like acyl-CoA dehydrogenase
MPQIADSSPPLTEFAEDERIFRDTVRSFAAVQVQPLVREMDEQATIPRHLIDQLFELGVMGIEVP